MIVVAAVCLSTQVKAQQFGATLKYIPEGWFCVVKTVMGFEEKGTMQKASFNDGGFLKSITLKNDQGEMIGYPAESILWLNTQGTIFEQVLMPKSEDDYVLLQLLNKGFDRKLKVYLNPSEDFYAKDGKMMYYSYYYRKTDAKEIDLIKKSNYKKVATVIFGNCDEFFYDRNSKFDYDLFQEDVIKFDSYCQ